MRFANLLGAVALFFASPALAGAPAIPPPAQTPVYPVSVTPSQLAGTPNALLNFQEGAGTIAYDATGNGNNLTFASGANAPTWRTVNGIQQGLAHWLTAVGVTPQYGTFPASTSLTDATMMNSKTLTWAGCLYPLTPTASGKVTTENPTGAVTGDFSPSNAYILGFTAIFGGSNRADIAMLHLSGNVSGSRYSYQPGIYTENSQVKTYSLTPLSANCHVITWELTSASDGYYNRIFVDDAEIGYSNHFGNAYDVRAIGDYYTLGATPWNVSMGLHGITTAVAAFPGLLSPSQVFQNHKILMQTTILNRGLSTNYGRAGTTGNVCVFQGDSFGNNTPGQTRTGTSADGLTWYPTVSVGLMTNACTPTYRNMASKTVIEMLSDFDALVAPAYSQIAQFNIDFEEGGINDLNVTGSTTATVIANRLALARKAISMGFKAVVATMPDSLNQSTNVETVNIALRKAAVQFPANTYYVVDWANNPLIGQQYAWNQGSSSSTCALLTANPSGPAAAWSSATTYAANQAAYYNNVLYYSVAGGNLNNTPSGASAFWTTSYVYTDCLHPSYSAINLMAQYNANIYNYITSAYTLAYPHAVTASTYTIAPADAFISAAPSGAQTLTLPACYGWSTTEPFTVYNATSGQTVTVAAPAGLNLNGVSAGTLSVPNFGSRVFIANIVSDTASGCAWSSN